MNATLVTIALLLLITAIVLPSGVLSVFYNPVAQLVAAVVVVATLLFVDPFAGLVLGLALLAIYFRLYRDSEMAKDWARGDEPRTAGPMARLVSGYITPKHLEDAQNNVVSNDKEMIGISGVNGEAVYSSQGTDAMMPGYDKPKQLTGTAIDYSSLQS